MVNFKSDTKVFLAIFIGVMITATFLIGISDQTFEQTTIRTFTNVTHTAPAINVTLDIAGRTLVSSIEAYNGSGTSCLNLGCNLQTQIGSNGLETVQLIINDTVAHTVNISGLSINVTYTAEPDGYAQNSGTRGITSLILIIAALAILVTVIVILWGGSLGDLAKGKRS